MPLYIAKSGDLDRSYRCLTDWLTHWQTLKDSATQLLIECKGGAPATQCTFSITGWSLFASQWLNMPSIEKIFTLDHFWETSIKQAISQKVFFLCPEKKLSNTVESICILCLLEVTRKKWYCKQYFRLPPNNNVPIMLCASWMSSRRTDPRFPPTIWFFQTYWPRTKSFLYLFQSCFCFRS